MDTLRHLSLELGDEWRKLAHQLNVRRVRVQAIMRNTTLAGRSIEDAKYVMLLTWMKAAPRGLNKVTYPDSPGSPCSAHVGRCVRRLFRYEQNMIDILVSGLDFYH